ncbi:cell wall hydrolase [Brevibacillus laterosporus]|uniref:cell wall hydrolase n=1 Tax=Brevibacillus laterosporus TaxID=1465 RepID=UPI00215BC071|nr:cell wall hydrolase [Brevibacillus laterosporus]MCR8994567.1 cell wall hydrolase [Brevibacillus laterosporus]
MEKTVQGMPIGRLITTIASAMILVGVPASKTIPEKKEEQYALPQEVVDYSKFYIEKMMEQVQKAQVVAASIQEPNEESKQEEKVKESKSYTDEDIYWLSRVVSSEAKGESVKGQIAVANVVLNRVESDKYPDSIKKVVFQKRQFSSVRDKSIYKEPTEEAVKSAKKALKGERVINKDVMFFYNPKIATSRWLDTRRKAVDIGSHRFTY